MSGNAAPGRSMPGVAVQCVAMGSPPQLRVHAIEAAADEQPGAGEALVAVECSVFDVGDRLLLQGHVQPRPGLPFVPGRDAGGRVLAVGASVPGLAPGDAVVFTRASGAWRSRQLVEAGRLVRVPDGLALADVVAAMPSHVTALHALQDRAGLRSGERVLVLGARGALGRAAVQLARHRGARVFTLERDAEPGALRLCGLDGDQVIQASAAHLRQALGELLGPAGADVVVDPIGDIYTDPAARNLAWHGRLLVVGFAAGTVPSLPTNLLLRGASLIGVHRAGLAEREPQAYARVLAQALDLLARGVLQPRPHEVLPVRDIARLWSMREALPQERALVITFGEPAQ